MKVKILLFGILADKAGARIITIENVADLSDMKDKLENKFSSLKSMKYLTAINQQIINNNVELHEGDEIALMPPFAGG